MRCASECIFILQSNWFGLVFVFSLFARSYYSPPSPPPPPPRPTTANHTFYFCSAESIFSHAIAIVLYYIKISPLKIFQVCSFPFVALCSLIHSVFLSFFIFFSLSRWLRQKKKNRSNVSSAMVSLFAIVTRLSWHFLPVCIYFDSFFRIFLV